MITILAIKYESTSESFYQLTYCHCVFWLYGYIGRFDFFDPITFGMVAVKPCGVGIFAHFDDPEIIPVGEVL